MAYGIQYYIRFQNDLGDDVEIQLLQKDVAAPDIVPVLSSVVSLDITVDGENNDKFDTILSRSLACVINVSDADAITWETFVAAAQDEWMVICTINTLFHFHGFLTPETGQAAFLDKPYDITLQATDCLKLLEQTPLTDAAGNKWDNESIYTSTNHYLNQYIAGALFNTKLGLPIRIYCSLYENSCFNRFADAQEDMYNQLKLDYRTFDKDATTFVDCLTALKTILTGHSRLFYWNGMWVIYYLADHQYRPGGLWHTDYNADGSIAGGIEESDNYTETGKGKILSPILADQLASTVFAAKSYKSTFKYNIWDEIPLNNKFDRGTFLPLLSSPTTQAFTIPDWDFGNVDSSSNFPVFPFGITPTATQQPYSLRTYDAFGVEKSRVIIIPSQPDGPRCWLKSRAIPVLAGDLVSISIDKKYQLAAIDTDTDPQIACFVYVVKGTDYWMLDGGYPTNQGLWTKNQTGAGINSIKVFGSSQEFQSGAATSLAMPVDGDLYIAFDYIAYGGAHPNNAQYWQNFQFSYTSRVANGYKAIQGDFWERDQNKFFLDNADEEVFISDGPRKVVKGTILTNTEHLTDGWYRFNSGESRNFKDLINQGRYNHSYRRFYKIEGTFEGLNIYPQNNQPALFPLGFHKEYRFTDMSPNRDFILVTPLQMDVIKGRSALAFIEVKASDDDGTQNADTSTFKYLF